MTGITVQEENAGSPAQADEAARPKRPGRPGVRLTFARQRLATRHALAALALGAAVLSGGYAVAAPTDKAGDVKVDSLAAVPGRLADALLDASPLPPSPADQVPDFGQATKMADSSGSGGSGGGDRKLEEKKKKDDKKKKKKQAWDDFLEGVREDTKEQEKKQKGKSN